METTWLTMSVPSWQSSCRAIEPIATRAAVSRALARSSTSRISSWPYFTTPARSAWPGTRAGDHRPIGARGVGRLLRLRVHRPLPVLPVLVRNEERDRRAGRHAVAHAAERLRAIGFDGHTPSAAVAPLAASQLRGDRVEVDRQTGGDALEDRDQTFAVRLAGSEKSQHSRNILSEISAHSGTPQRDSRTICVGDVLALGSRPSVAEHD